MEMVARVGGAEGPGECAGGVCMCEEVWCVQEGCACVRKCNVCRRGVHV